MAPQLESKGMEIGGSGVVRRAVGAQLRYFAVKVGYLAGDRYSRKIMRRAIYPGSFDPITNGHLDVLQRAAGLFDELVVGVARDSTKQSLFTAEERVELVREATDHIPNLTVLPFQGLLVDFAKKQNAAALVRGLRAVSDFEFEFQLALMNRKLEPNLETMFLMPREELTYISSRLVKEIARLGGNVNQFVPPHVVTALKSKLNP